MDDSTAARSRALAMPEILTLVFQELDMQTLLVSAQRVCYQWRILIKETPSVQEKLFFKPSCEKKEESVPRFFNPLLAAKFPTFIPRIDNPTRPISECIDLNLLDMVVHREKLPAYLRLEASWRQMLIHQPPAYTLAAIESSSTRQGRTIIRSKCPRQDAGLRMGTLFQWILLHPGYFFRSGVAIFFGGASPVNTPFFNSGGKIEELYVDIVANHDVIFSSRSEPPPLEDEEMDRDEDMITRNFLFSEADDAGLFVDDLTREFY